MSSIEEPLLHIALINPEIPQNTGNIGRLSLGVGARLHLVYPLGFDISEKAVRRAGLDYWSDVDLQIHESLNDFIDWLGDRDSLLLTTKGSESIATASVSPGIVLIFGSETKGAPDVLHNTCQRVHLPMHKRIRSYNLSNSVAIASYFTLQQINPAWIKT